MATNFEESSHLQAFRVALTRLDSFLLDPNSDEGEYAKIYTVYDAISTAGFSPVAREDLPSLFSAHVERVEMRPDRRVLVLKQVPKAHLCLPILAISFDTYLVKKKGKKSERREIKECQLQLGIFTTTKRLGEAKIQDIQAIGLRFEMSHGPGDHDYAHVQFVISMEKGAGDLPGAPAWIPDTQPAIPLDSEPNDASALIICLIQSLYGPKVAAEKFRSIWDYVTGQNGTNVTSRIPRILL
jgi:hypothetical protein